MKRVAIVGFGLIGGSLALALRRSGGVHVTAIDRAPVLARAEAKNAADEHLPLEEAESLKVALERSELTVLAVSAHTTLRVFPSCPRHAPVGCGSGLPHREIPHPPARA